MFARICYIVYEKIHFKDKLKNAKHRGGEGKLGALSLSSQRSHVRIYKDAVLASCSASFRIGPRALIFSPLFQIWNLSINLNNMADNATAPAISSPASASVKKPTKAKPAPKKTTATKSAPKTSPKTGTASKKSKGPVDHPMYLDMATKAVQVSSEQKITLSFVI